MLSEMNQLALAAWMVTYLLHSTILLLVVWGLAAALRHRQEALIEVLWRFALIAPILTTSLQVGLSIRPLTGALPVPERAVSNIPTAPAEPAASALSTITEPVPDPGAAPAAPASDGSHPRSALDESAAQAGVGVTGPGHALAPPAECAISGETQSALRRALVAAGGALGSQHYLTGILFVIALAIGVFVARSIAACLRLKAMMRDRRPVTDGPVAAMLQRLQGRSSMHRRIRLTASEHLAVPIAFGVFRPEICLPRSVLERFDSAGQESVLAHELAHHVRHDPTWLAAAHLLERLLFFQPLNGAACRRLRNLAELHCDAWAAEQTGDRITLARCLTEVASWIMEQRAEPALVRVMGMAGSPSALRQRIVRLLDDASPSPARARRVRRSFILLGPLLLAVMIWVVPGVGAPSRRAEPAEGDPSAAPTERAPGDVRSLGEQGAALLDDLAVLDGEIAGLRETADRLPPEVQWVDVMDDLTFRAQTLRRRGEGMVDALPGAPDDVADEQIDDDELDY